MTLPRRAQICLSQTPYYHCVSRCVRRAFLCGSDAYSGKDFEHRKRWLVDRLMCQADVFSIDVCAYAIMSNHYHIVLCVDLDRAASWSDREVLRRWTRIFGAPLLVKRALDGQPMSAAEHQTVASIARIWRGRLTDISWYMRCLNEHIARRANREDDCTGRFWEGRFKSQALLDEASLLCCMAYVDLNPRRAGVATTLEGSEFTSIQARLRTQACENRRSDSRASASLRPFNKGDSDRCLPISLSGYVELLKHSEPRATQLSIAGSAIASSQAVTPVGISVKKWQLLMLEIHSGSLSAIGQLDRLEKFARATGRSRMQGVVRLSAIFDRKSPG